MNYENGWDNGKETILFAINIHCRQSEYTIKRRFKKFDELHEKLAKVYGNLPELPPKSMLKVSKAVDLDKRCRALDKYLKVRLESNLGTMSQEGCLLGYAADGIPGTQQQDANSTKQGSFSSGVPCRN